MSHKLLITMKLVTSNEIGKKTIIMEKISAIFTLIDNPLEFTIINIIAGFCIYTATKLWKDTMIQTANSPKGNLDIGKGPYVYAMASTLYIQIKLATDLPQYEPSFSLNVFA